MSDKQVNQRVWLKAFWGFNPEEAGYLGFTKEGNRDNFIDKAKPDDLVLIYGVDSPYTNNQDVQRLLGFMKVELKPIMDKERLSNKAYKNKVDMGWEHKWNYSVPVVQAWNIERSHYDVRHFALETYNKNNGRILASRGMLLQPSEVTKVLQLPVVETNVFGQPEIIPEYASSYPIEDILKPSRGINPTFGRRSSVYEDGDNFLYVLKAKGPAAAVLGLNRSELGNKSLIKVGYSNNPERRCNEHNKTLPQNSVFRWEVFKISRPFIDGEKAKNAEDILKERFAQQFKSLGGEFYLCETDLIEKEFYLIPGAANYLKI